MVRKGLENCREMAGKGHVMGSKNDGECQEKDSNKLGKG